MWWQYRYERALLGAGADGGDAAGLAAGGRSSGVRSDGGAALSDSRAVDQASFTSTGGGGGGRVVDGPDSSKKNVSSAAPTLPEQDSQYPSRYVLAGRHRA